MTPWHRNGRSLKSASRHPVLESVWGRLSSVPEKPDTSEMEIGTRKGGYKGGWVPKRKDQETAESRGGDR